MSALWVFYVALFSETILYFDSFGYEELGRQIAQGHWIIFKTSPTREPLYPLWIALHLGLSNILHLSYTNLLLLTQGLILLLSQLFMAHIYERIKLSDKLSAVLILYFVLSPAILRSSLIVYSEILTYPLMLLACYVSSRVWINLTSQNHSLFYRIRKCLLLGMVFLPLMFTKAIFEPIVLLFIVIFSVGLYFTWVGQHKRLHHAILFALVATATFLFPVIGYKYLNQMYNRHFAFTDRGSWALYGTTARRILPTTPQKDLAQMLYVFPDKSLCERSTSPAACAHWHYGLSDSLGYTKMQTLTRELGDHQDIDKILLHQSFALMLAHPFKTIKGMFWEGSKLLFWEFPSWGMVILPREIKNIYEWGWLKQCLLWGVNILNVLFFLAGGVYVLRRMLSIKNSSFLKDEGDVYVFVSFLLIVLYIAAHSFFFLNERNALPIIPLFLVFIGALINRGQRLFILIVGRSNK